MTVTFNGSPADRTQRAGTWMALVFTIRTHLLPMLFAPEELRGGIAIVLDILRASTTIVHALENGARAVAPVLEVDDALALQSRLRQSTAAPSVLLGGERDGLLIPGFDLDNNPFAYTADVVQGATIVFTTSNGTRALHRSAEAERIVIGSFVNLSAVTAAAADTGLPIHLVCAGTRGRISAEDALCAGAIIDRLLAETQRRDEDLPDDQSQLAHAAFVQAASSAGGLPRAIRESFGGRNCRRLKFDSQIDRAATVDLFTRVPEYHHDTGEIL